MTLLFDIAQCYRNLGDYDRAQFFFRRFTVAAPDSPNRPAVERLIAEMGRLEQERQAKEQGGGGGTASPGVAVLAATDSVRREGQPGTSLLAPATAASSTPARRPIYRRPWFWGGVGAAVVAGVVAAVVLTHEQPSGTLPAIDAR